MHVFIASICAPLGAGCLTVAVRLLLARRTDRSGRVHRTGKVQACSVTPAIGPPTDPVLIRLLVRIDDFDAEITTVAVRGYRVGDEIAIRHPDGRPEQAELDDWPSRNGAAVAAGAAGLCLIAVAVLSLTSR